MKPTVTAGRSFFIALFAVALLGAASVAWAYPTPGRVPTRWQLKFQSGPLRLFQTTGFDGEPENYWYFTYKVSNFTGRERFWAPRFTLFTDTGGILDAGRGVPPSIEHTLIDLLGKEYLERQNQVIGKIFVGEPNAIDGIVVWPAEDMNVTRFSIFISGVSGETVEIASPATGEAVIMQKTLQRDYTVPGEPRARGDDPVELDRELWVMR